VPIYEYACPGCGKRSTALLPSWSAADPACPHCAARSLRRLVSTFAAPRSGGGSDLDQADFGEDSYDSGGFGDEGGFDDDF
jgi:putative FmdB family regulatory protein